MRFGSSLTSLSSYRSHSLRFVFTIIPAMLAANDALAARPEPPAIDRDVHLVDNGEFLDPYIPALRTSNDGRVAVEVESGTINVYLMVPEKVDASWHLTTPGTSKILADQSPFRDGIRHAPFDNRYYSHQTICETTNAFPSPDDDANPYVCGANGNNDCYDLTHVGWTRGSDENEPTRLWGTPLTVEVQHPKTPQARIVDVRVGDSVGGPNLPSPVFWETTVTSDGRLLVGRFGRRNDWTFINARTGQPFTGRYDMVYSLIEDGAEACDVRQWQRFFPIAHAPYDPRMKGKYGIAAFPFRGGEGRPVPETVDFGGTYPWIDREGNNLFMTTLSMELSEQGSAYPNRCLPNTVCLDRENDSSLKGDAVAGLWTQGKLVHMDNLLNNIDWGLPIDPAGHRLVTMYESADGSAVEVRAGSGGRNKIHEYRALRGRTHNSAIQDSVQSLFNHHAELRPKSPRDIVWLMSNGKATDELVFDDYIDPDGFIVSSMIAALGLRSNASVRYNNGYSSRSGFSEDVHLQNAATGRSDRWQIPAFGLVAAGTGRAEPIALGGIHGRGFWLDGDNEIRYLIESQPQDPANSDWYVGIFIDSRFANDNGQRNLIRYPDGSALRLDGRRDLLFVLDNNVVKRLRLPQTLPQTGWAHLALNLSDRNRNITVLHNGYALESFRIDEGFFNLVPGNLIVGGSGGFRGWVDDFKVFAHNMNPEVACNQAGGTLVGVNGNSQWRSVADRYPQSSHAAINRLVDASGRDTFSQYACYTNYRDDDGIDVNTPPTGTVSIREAINFPEGPIVHNQPRPDSTQNRFCQSCHHASATGGLGLDALALNASLSANEDPRRQPTQHLRMVHGNIPAGWLNGRVTQATQVGREGFMLDPLLLTRQRPAPQPEPSAPSTVGFDRAAIEVSEAAGSVVARIALSAPANDVTSVDVATSVDSAKSGTDFYGKYRKLSFQPGETEKRLEIAILNDTVQEDLEQFKVRLFNPNDLEIGQRFLTVNIADDDDGSVPTLSVESLVVSEADRLASVVITLTPAATTPVTVHIATQPDQATNGSDYYGLHRVVEFAAGETRKTVPITILNDNEVEPEESFKIRLFGETGTSVGTRRGTVSIVSDD